MIGFVEELKQTAEEIPWFFASVLLAVLMCVGVNAEIVCGADGDQAKLSAGRLEASMAHVAQLCERETRRSISGPAPGVTMLVGIRSFWVEMSIPESAVQAKVDVVRTGFALLRGCDRTSGRAHSLSRV